MLFALSMRHISNLERSCARVSRAYESENWKSVRLSFSSQVFPGGAGEGSAGAGVVPSRARRLASIAHPVARRAGLSKFKEFASRSCRARVQAQAGTKAWTDQASTGLSGQQTSAAERASAVRGDAARRRTPHGSPSERPRKVISWPKGRGTVGRPATSHASSHSI